MEVSRQTISSLENGRYNPSLVLAFKIANYLEKVSRRFLFLMRMKMNKNNLKLVILFLITIIGYFIGSFVYSIEFESNNTLMALSSITTSGILSGLYLLFLKKKYP